MKQINLADILDIPQTPKARIKFHLALRKCRCEERDEILIDVYCLLTNCLDELCQVGRTRAEELLQRISDANG